MLASARNAGHVRDELENSTAVSAEWVLAVELALHLDAPADSPSGSATILGGTAAGPMLNGIVQPGRLEWKRDAGHGVLSLAAHYDLQAKDGLRIHVADRATVVAPTQGCWETPISTMPELEVVCGAAAACPRGLYVGRMDTKHFGVGKLRVNLHRIL
jgi:hypothetical protein